jgi:hypothetical protein
MPGDAPISLLIVFNDGHQKRFAMSEIASERWSATRHGSVGDDGWHDGIRKIGDNQEKRAFAPRGTFSDKPDNVTSAGNLSPSARFHGPA